MYWQMVTREILEAELEIDSAVGRMRAAARDLEVCGRALAPEAHALTFQLSHVLMGIVALGAAMQREDRLRHGLSGDVEDGHPIRPAALDVDLGVHPDGGHEADV